MFCPDLSCGPNCLACDETDPNNPICTVCRRGYYPEGGPFCGSCLAEDEVPEGQVRLQATTTQVVSPYQVGCEHTVAEINFDDPSAAMVVCPESIPGFKVTNDAIATVLPGETKPMVWVFREREEYRLPSSVLVDHPRVDGTGEQPCHPCSELKPVASLEVMLFAKTDAAGASITAQHDGQTFFSTSEVAPWTTVDLDLSTLPQNPDIVIHLQYNSAEGQAVDMQVSMPLSDCNSGGSVVRLFDGVLAVIAGKVSADTGENAAKLPLCRASSHCDCVTKATEVVLYYSGVSALQPNLADIRVLSGNYDSLAGFVSISAPFGRALIHIDVPSSVDSLLIVHGEDDVEAEIDLKCNSTPRLVNRRSVKKKPVRWSANRFLQIWRLASCVCHHHQRPACLCARLWNNARWRHTAGPVQRVPGRSVELDLLTGAAEWNSGLACICQSDIEQ